MNETLHKSDTVFLQGLVIASLCMRELMEHTMYVSHDHERKTRQTKLTT